MTMDARPRRAAARLAFALALAGALSACAQSTPRAIYDLSARVEPSPATRRSQVQILVPPPRALNALDTDSIAVRTSPQTLAYFKQVTWADSLPTVVQARVVQAFIDSGEVRAVGVPGQGLLINYQIPIDIRSFELDTSGSPKAIVEFSVMIVDDANGKVVAQRTFRAEAPAPSDQVGAAVSALDAAMAVVLKEMVAWAGSVV
jgi:cholesterol transport system auxiliary component